MTTPRLVPPTPAQAVELALATQVPGVRDATFIEFDLLDSAPRSPHVALHRDRLIEVHREIGTQQSGIVCGIMSHSFDGHVEPTRRVWLVGDAGRAMGAVAEQECRRIIAAFDYATEHHLPVEWVAVSAGARISMSSGSETMDWCAAVVGRILEFTQAGGEVVVIVAGVNVGAQSYWNSVATMLNHCAGMLVMVEGSTMVLTGRRALAMAGGVSAPDDVTLGGYPQVMGPNGQSHHRATDLAEAYRLVLTHHELLAATARPRHTHDRWDRNVCWSSYDSAGEFESVGAILDPGRNPRRKSPFAIGPVMAAVADSDSPHLGRWSDQEGADGAVVWDTRIGGQAVTLIGIESHPREGRSGAGPGEDQSVWAAGTLYPQAARKIARAFNHASGRRPVAVLANLAGFDGSAWSLRNGQLELGAEIARAVVNFVGPILVVIIGRFHGGAYVVFNKTLNPRLRLLALTGTKVSVIGGSAAAEVVLTKAVQARASELAGGDEPSEDELRAARADVAAEFDAVHSVQRAHSVGSVDAVIEPAALRPTVIAELNAARELTWQERADAGRTVAQ
jgi:acetyl-CoA carboxylase carboxyltransferase component